MIDRLVCADGGNPDPTTTHGYPRHLTELLPATPKATFDRSIGYYEPDATSHEALDRDTEAVKLARAGQLPRPDRNTHSPRPK